MWAGKQDAVRSLLTPSRGTLVPELDKSIDFDDAPATSSSRATTSRS